MATGACKIRGRDTSQRINEVIIHPGWVKPVGGSKVSFSWSIEKQLSKSFRSKSETRSAIRLAGALQYRGWSGLTDRKLLELVVRETLLFCEGNVCTEIAINRRN